MTKQLCLAACVDNELCTRFEATEYDYWLQMTFLGKPVSDRVRPATWMPMPPAGSPSTNNGSQVSAQAP